MKRYERRLCGLIMLLLFPLATLFSQDAQTITVKGIGAILDGDVAKARDDALSDALRNAVEQVAGTLVESSVMVEQYQVITDEIHSRTLGYVQTYKIIDEQRSADQQFEITVEAVVKVSDLEKDLEGLGVLMGRKQMPRLLIFINEKNMSQVNMFFRESFDMNTTENEIVSHLIEKGFRFVDRNIVVQTQQRDALQAALSDNQAARQIAAGAGAEVFIVGNAIAQAAKNSPSVVRDAGLISCKATLTLRAVRADDGRVIAAVTESATAVNADELAGGNMALAKASASAAEELSGKIAAAWQQDVYSGTSVQLRILEVPSFADLVRFKNLISEKIRGVSRVFQREYAQQTALFELETKGNANQAAEEMALKDFAPYKVEVLSVSQNTVVMKFRRIP